MKFLSISSALVLLVLSQTAVALPFLTGNVEITGLATETNDGTNFTGINWGDVDSTVAGNQGDIVAASGDFAGLTGFDATLSDFTVAGLPAIPLWSATDGSTTFTFDLTTVVVDVFNIGGFVHLTGTGILSASSGFAATAGIWDYSSQSGLSFSSNTVPEPGIAALIGMGLLGFGFLSRRQKKINQAS